MTQMMNTTSLESKIMLFSETISVLALNY